MKFFLTSFVFPTPVLVRERFAPGEHTVITRATERGLPTSKQ